VKLAADANVLLAALIGGRTRRVLGHPQVEEVLRTSATLAEVQEYGGHLARKKRLPVTTVDRSSYSSSLPEARKRIAQPDPEDVELLALAIHFNLPVWCNDNDFEDAVVFW
jgi:predicted nucleic acid-binding protein